MIPDFVEEIIAPIVFPNVSHDNDPVVNSNDELKLEADTPATLVFSNVSRDVVPVVYSKYDFMLEADLPDSIVISEVTPDVVLLVKIPLFLLIILFIFINHFKNCSS